MDCHRQYKQQDVIYGAVVDVLFVFVKKDGTMREAWGTTKKELVAAHVNGRGESRENYACCAFWSVEDGAWRSFRWESLIKVF